MFFFKQNGFKFWAKFLERFGTPILLGKCKDTETADMNEALLNAHAQSVLSIDAEDDVSLLSTSGSNGTAGSAFETFNRTIAQQIQKIILGQTLTSGTDGKGSYALGQVHENVRADKLKSDMRLVTPTLQAVVDALCQEQAKPNSQRIWIWRCMLQMCWGISQQVRVNDTSHILRSATLCSFS